MSPTIAQMSGVLFDPGDLVLKHQDGSVYHRHLSHRRGEFPGIYDRRLVGPESSDHVGGKGGLGFSGFVSVQQLHFDTVGYTPFVKLSDLLHILLVEGNDERRQLFVFNVKAPADLRGGLYAAAVQHRLFFAGDGIVPRVHDRAVRLRRPAGNVVEPLDNADSEIISRESVCRGGAGHPAADNQNVKHRIVPFGEIQVQKSLAVIGKPFHPSAQEEPAVAFGIGAEGGEFAHYQLGDFLA